MKLVLLILGNILPSPWFNTTTLPHPAGAGGRAGQARHRDLAKKQGSQGGLGLISAPVSLQQGQDRGMPKQLPSLPGQPKPLSLPKPKPRLPFTGLCPLLPPEQQSGVKNGGFITNSTCFHRDLLRKCMKQRGRLARNAQGLVLVHHRRHLAHPAAPWPQRGLSRVSQQDPNLYGCRDGVPAAGRSGHPLRGCPQPHPSLGDISGGAAFML